MIHRVPMRMLAVPMLFVFAISANKSVAKDVFLTVGGGIGPQSTQISLERNVLFQQRVLAEHRTDSPQHIVLFADGDDSAPDVQFRDPEFGSTCPPARRLMAELIGDDDEMDLVYRTNQITTLEGPSDSDLMKRQLRSLGRELQSGDRLIIYATGHGGPAEDPYEYYYDDDDSEEDSNEYDTTFYFYDGDNVSASEFTSWLDHLSADVEVILVMVQCHAGGFSHTLFHHADAELGISNHNRCGFFAQVYDRGAAGCTPNADESEYQEYSSYFWGALAGQTRTGDKTIAADYDEDGRVSFAEAHAYAVIESDTIDIPVRTSDAFLRHYSNLGKKQDNEDNDGNPIGKLFGLLATKPAAEEGKVLRELGGPIADLLDLARPDQRAILQQLPAKLKLGDNPTIESVRLMLSKVEAEQLLANTRHHTAHERCTLARGKVREELLETWPELSADYAPLAMALVAERAEEFQAKVEGLASYQAYCRAKERRDQHQEKTEELSHQEAKLQRLLHTCESVVLADNLAKLMPQELVDRYERLVKMEEGSL